MCFTVVPYKTAVGHVLCEILGCFSSRSDVDNVLYVIYRGLAWITAYTSKSERLHLVKRSKQNNWFGSHIKTEFHREGDVPHCSSKQNSISMQLFK